MTTPKQETTEALAPTLRVGGAPLWRGLLDPAGQVALLAEVLAVLDEAPPVQLRTPGGKPMSVRMTAAGAVGWTSGPAGYGYAPSHPSGRPWPPIPPMLLALWARLLPGARAPDSCLVNIYDAAARMGLHQDRDEADLGQPVLSVSLGDAALFRVGGTARGGRTESIWLESGDIVALAGVARLAFHGVDRIRAGTSSLIPGGGRINLTLRVAR
ncbi:MAG: alpha-ketoglutarate-dependent dioxygenase AlkB [Rhodobacteraceae bacterium]|jgi:alkylated DNA repair protein (DNA oxidative demethylase)|nr:alpha-ketoglutarate-dependent dioxygenase AlkB [Paracoccaceae bacterium]